MPASAANDQGHVPGATRGTRSRLPASSRRHADRPRWARAAFSSRAGATGEMMAAFHSATLRRSVYRPLELAWSRRDSGHGRSGGALRDVGPFDGSNRHPWCRCRSPITARRKRNLLNPCLDQVRVADRCAGGGAARGAPPEEVHGGTPCAGQGNGGRSGGAGHVLCSGPRAGTYVLRQGRTGRRQTARSCGGSPRSRAWCSLEGSITYCRIGNRAIEVAHASQARTGIPGCGH